MIKKYGDIYSSIFLMVVAVVLYIATFSFKRLTVTKIGSEFVPQLAAIGMLIFSVLLLIKGIRDLKSIKAKNETGTDTGDKGSSSNFLAVAITMGLLVIYIALMPSIGFIITTAVYLFLQFYIFGNKSIRSIVLYLVLSVIVSVAVYYFFRSIFHLMLPAGILG